MGKNTYKVIGLMSGTSLDGLDMVYCNFNCHSGNWEYELVQCKSLSYSLQWEDKLRNAIYITGKELLELNIDYGKYLGIQVKDFIDTHHLHVDFIASHGHTVYHQPEKGLTYQIGSGQEIAIEAGVKVICDFRKKDVAFGGQGAPLVPIGDHYLFSQYSACLNLGGIANVSFQVINQRIAFDIVMANMLLNYLANKLDKRYDVSGLIARSGLPDRSLLEKLNSLEYFKLAYPKSLGNEWFLSTIIPIISQSNSSIEDKMCTSVEHQAIQIGKVFKNDISIVGDVLITGGGAFNNFLIERIKIHIPDKFSLVIPDANTIEFKEAIIFAFMGVLKERNEINSLKSVTGARQDVSGGEVFYPN